MQRLHGPTRGRVGHPHGLEDDEVPARPPRHYRIVLGGSILGKNSVVKTALQSTLVGTPM